MPYFFTLVRMKTLYTNAAIYAGGRFAAGEFAVEEAASCPSRARRPTGPWTSAAGM